MIFVALQNPGSQYEKTRHNAGAIALHALDSYIDNQFTNHNDSEFVKFITQNRFGSFNYYYSDEYMNLSGNFVKKVLKKENAKPEDLYMFFDDVNVPVGKFIISVGQGASSHNGVKSVQELLKNNDFKRVRIGVGKIGKDGKVEDVHGEGMSEKVLSKLNDQEIAIIQSLAPKILEKIAG